MDRLLPGSELGFVLGDVSRHWRQAIDRALEAASLSLTPCEVRALSHVVRSPGLRQNRLAEIMQVEAMTASAYALKLEERGLIRRDVDPTDKRARLLMPAPAAAEFLARIAPDVAVIGEAAVQGIDAEHRRELKDILLTMRRNLAAFTAPRAEA